MVSTLVAADWFIIPVFPSGYDLKGLELLMRTVNKVRERYNPVSGWQECFSGTTTALPLSTGTFTRCLRTGSVKRWSSTQQSAGAFG